MGLRLNPPPGWPPVPDGFVPSPGWQPDPSWPPVPPGWELWVDDGLPPNPVWGTPAVQAAGFCGMAIASFVFGLLGFTIIGAVLAIIFGILALNRIGVTLQRGKGLAIAGLVLSGLWIVMFGVAAGLAVIGYQVARDQGGPLPASSSPLPNVSGGTTVSVFSLVTGDCFDNPTATGMQTVNLVEKIPCTQPHNAQIFATFNVKGSALDYPGTAKMQGIATSGCNARIAASLDKAKVNSGMTIHFLFPLQDSWLGGRRTISCIIVSPTPTLRSSVLAPGTG